ncbi:MAG: hypothetical protein JOY90_38475 [Bradyrhizobium sp.]|uniref:DUF6931 family protein n=1 Tax=Bradyrhizobium sp. TaxID=376 RepID=UPI001DC75504|nr:hypothetical protein [Bradyrhizobium sp.]MBV9566289.1 hypothetical protein [Bradyrhizobium sp.]
MSRIRFATIRALFDSFPEALQNIGAEPTDESPVPFLRKLAAEGKPEDAVAVCAYLLPRREAVWWGCASARTLLGDKLQDDAAALAAAEAWVREPTDENRRAALDTGTKAASKEPLTWLALAAGWSSGTFASTPFPVPAYMTSRAVRISLLISIRRAASDARPKLLQSCLARGIELAEAAP